jgi:aminotransferase EvaB
VFCDIDERSGLMNIARLRDVLTERTRAVIPVHLYGNMVDVGALRAAVSGVAVYIVEDCAQAHGATLGGRPAGSFGDAAAFSFYPTKNLGALGDGGLCFTRDPALAEAMRRARCYGFERRDYATGRGLNSRLDELQAAMLRVKLRRLPSALARRRQLAARYDALLPAWAERLEVSPAVEHGRHLYVARFERRDAIQERLASDGIASGIHYRTPLHQMPAFAHARLPESGLPATEHHARRILSLPLHPALSDADVARVTQSLSGS